MELPKTASSDGSADTPLGVSITKDGTYLFGEKPIEEGALRGEFRKAKKQNPNASLVISGDSEAFHGDVMHVIDLAKIEGVTKFAISVDRR